MHKQMRLTMEAGLWIKEHPKEAAVPLIINKIGSVFLI